MCRWVSLRSTHPTRWIPVYAGVTGCGVCRGAEPFCRESEGVPQFHINSGLKSRLELSVNCMHSTPYGNGTKRGAGVSPAEALGVSPNSKNSLESPFDKRGD